MSCGWISPSPCFKKQGETAEWHCSLMIIVDWRVGLMLCEETCGETFSLFRLLVRLLIHVFLLFKAGSAPNPVNAAVRRQSFKQEFCKVFTKHVPAKTLKCHFDWKKNRFPFLFTFWAVETLSLILWERETVLYFSWNVLAFHGLPLLTLVVRNLWLDSRSPPKLRS